MCMNAMVHQWPITFCGLYPSSNVLISSSVSVMWTAAVKHM
jgi:hypothetical protein